MSDNSGPRHGAGDVPLTLGGDELVLKPSVQAAQQLSRMHGGLAEIVFRLQKYDFDLLCTVVGFGLGLSGKPMKELPDRIFAEGMHDVNPRAIRYVSYLMNGGRPPPDEPVVEEAEEGEGPQTA